MKKFNLALWLGAAAMIVSACNFYNPSGDGDGSANRVALGDELFRAGRFGEAMTQYSLAIKEDSTLSAAYFGYFKATLRFHDLDNVGLLRDLDSTNNAEEDSTGNKKIYLLRVDNQDLMTRRLRAVTEARHVLEILQDRDTLTQAFRYIRDTSAETRAKDPNYEARRAFILDYVAKGDAGVPGYRPASKFPLTDGRKTFAKLEDDYSIMQGVSAVSSVYDWNDDGIIDFGTGDSLSLKFQLSGNGTLSATGLVEDMQKDTAVATAMNQKITAMSKDLTQLTASINASKANGDTTSEAEVGAFASSLGDAITFYQFGDKKDNDGDGCVDEEIMDEKDNDGDGFIDEDARLFPLGSVENLDNDNNGQGGPGQLADAREDVASNFLLGFVVDWQAANSGAQFIKIKKGASNIDLRIKIQKDSLTLPSRRLLPGYAAKLDSAKTLIGGCWHNYTVPASKRASR